MYLKEIKASGFKSFAEKLEIKLDDAITCIVGPNGSGKSNVVDAVRWVLGEQSVKSLRGDGAMSDVIFAGSKSRNPLNVAMVELVFDNSDHYLSVPYTDISIKRKVYRSGENEYFLNGEKCRLKDILNLLLDSGIGKESFNIISQGEVQKILSNSPYDRRSIFEEAAGILKYKKRKEEALRKLDRTHNNLDRVQDIIEELEIQVEPLKEQSIKAEEYLTNKNGLDKYEVALLAYDIEEGNISLENAKHRKEKLEKEIMLLTNESTTRDASSLEDSAKASRLEKELQEKQKELLNITEEVEKINGERNLLRERNQNKEQSDVSEKIRKLLDEKGQCEKSIAVLNEDIKNKEELYKQEETNSNKLKDKIEQDKNKRRLLEEENTTLERNLINNNHKIDSLNIELENGGNIPNSVKSILREVSLTGIYNTIGNVLSIDDKYTKALEIAISSCKNFIITKDEQTSREAINYLKKNNLGRATFFPLSVIKERYVDNNTLSILKSEEGFVSVLSDLVSYDEKYKNIITNQLGTVLVTTTLEKANIISRKINARYKIVTLDGDVVHVGGSMSGGSSYSSRSSITIRQEIKKLQEKNTLYQEEINQNKKSINTLLKSINTNEQIHFKNLSNLVEKKQILESAQISLKELNEKLVILSKEWESYDAVMQDTALEKEQELTLLYNEKNTIKEKLQINIKNMRIELDSIKQKIEEDLAQDKVKNSTLRTYEKELREVEILMNRLDVKLDGMLLTLNEDYSLTFEKAKEDYKLDIEVEDARIKVNTYRNNIKRLGMVNLAAIDEYKRVNTRYEFLTKQKEDLKNAEATLLEIMNEMDDVMVEEFTNTFENIKREFRESFKELFKGGNADLKLTDPDNILTTGIEIVASPPGKKLTTISLLSGGEKTLTAISLLFAILNVRQIPFCLFDEVEAALDEANVDEFGKYLNHYKNKTQFLIITHKKKTMEYADTLYGITMQESGVSKLVSVKLSDKEEII